MPESKQDLACLVNGHTPPSDEQSYDLITTGTFANGTCTVCNHPMRGSKMWAGMKWRFTWRAL